MTELLSLVLKNAGFEAAYNPIPDWAGMVSADITRMRAITERAQIKAD